MSGSAGADYFFAGPTGVIWQAPPGSSDERAGDV